MICTLDSYDFSNVVEIIFDVLVLQMKYVVIILEPKNNQPNSKPHQRQEMEDDQDLSTNFSVIELDILDKKIRRLVCKLQKVRTVFYCKDISLFISHSCFGVLSNTSNVSAQQGTRDLQSRRCRIRRSFGSRRGGGCAQMYGRVQRSQS